MAWRQIGEKAIIWTNADPVDWRIYAALGVDELRIHTITSAGINWYQWFGLFLSVSESDIRYQTSVEFITISNTFVTTQSIYIVALVTNGFTYTSG